MTLTTYAREVYILEATALDIRVFLPRASSAGSTCVSRRRTLLALIYAKKSNDEIAHKLNVARNTVSTIKYPIVSKR